MTTLLDRSTVKARVNHICFWCGSEIEVGEQYIKSTQVDSGIFDTIKSHKKCGHEFINMASVGNLIWERKKNMTIEEIEEKLGYKINII